MNNCINLINTITSSDRLFVDMISIYCFKCKEWRNVPGNWWECSYCNNILDLDDNEYAPGQREYPSQEYEEEKNGEEPTCTTEYSESTKSIESSTCPICKKGMKSLLGKFTKCNDCNYVSNFDNEENENSESSDEDKGESSSLIEKNVTDAQGINYQLLSKKERGPFQFIQVKTDGEGYLDTYKTESEFKIRLLKEIDIKEGDDLDIDQLIQKYENYKNRDEQSFIIEGGNVLLQE